MGTPNVAELVAGWLDGQHVKWEAGEGVVAWAVDYGTDLRRAWNECPRADWLMAIAGACEAPEEPVVRVVAACAREALRFVPRKEARSTKGVLYAEGYRRGRPFDPMASNKVSTEAMAVLDDLNARVDAAKRARAAMGEQLRPAFARVLNEGIRSSVEAAARDPQRGTRRAMVEAARDALVAALATDKAMRLFRPREEELQRVLQWGHAARAAASSATVAASADASIHSLMLLARLAKGGLKPELAAGATRAAEIATRSGARVFTEGALVFQHAADAFGIAEALTDRAWEASVRAFFEVLAESTLADGPLPVSAPTEAMRAAREAFTEQGRDAKLREYADALRAAVPIAALKLPETPEEMPDPALDPRGALHRAFTALRPVADLLGAAALGEAIDVGLAILDAPGPLDKDALRPVVRTVHERVAEVFEQGVRETEGEMREKLREAAAEARQEVEEMSRMLDDLGPGAPN